ncbi:hypothetical protein ZWY2020_051891 [Hordeum vulgare]|nr:hypothetical protein ZWY2020_051891 [Hordeum vulgare]
MWTPPDGGQAVPESLTQLLLRHTALYTTALDIVKMGDSNPEAFAFAMSRLSDTRVGLKEKAKEQDGKGLEDVLHKENSDGQRKFNGDTGLKSSMSVEFTEETVATNQLKI